MVFKGSVFFLLLLVSISSGQEKRSLFDDLIPATKLSKRHFEIETPQQKLCDGRRSSQPCSNAKKDQDESREPSSSSSSSSSSSLFDQFPKLSEPMKGKKNSPRPASSAKPAADIAKYVPAPYPGQNSSQSLFDEIMTVEAPTKPSSRNDRPSSTIGWQDFASKTRSTSSFSSSSSTSGRMEEPSAKPGSGSSSSFGRNGVSKSRDNIMEKEKEALENLSNYVWKEALQTSRFERDSSKDDLNLIANSAQKLKHMMDGDFQNDDTDSTKLSSQQIIDRSFSDTGDRRKLSNQDLRSLAKLLNKRGNEVSEDSFPETKQSFVPFLDEIKANRLKDLRLALKLMKSIQRTKDHRYAGNTRSEDFELNLAQLLFDSNIQSLKDLTRTQRDSLDVLMKKMENTLQSSSEATENRASLSELLDESDSDFSVGFFRPPTPQSDPARVYGSPPQPSGLYGTPTVTIRPPVRPPPPTSRPPAPRPPPPRPPSPPPTAPPTPRPVGPPAPPPAVIRPVGPPSIGPPGIRPSQAQLEEPLFLSTDFNDDDDRFFLAPSQDEPSDVPSLDEEDVWTPLNPSVPPSTYGAATEARRPTSPADASSQGSHNYHYHYHTLTINQNRRDFNARPKQTRPSTASRDSGRVRRPLRLPLASPRRPSTSSYSSLESLPSAPSRPAAPPITFPPDNPSVYGPPQASPPEPTYEAPSRDPVPSYGPPQAEPAPIYGVPRDPPTPPPFRYGPPPADPPAPPAYRPPPRDPTPTYGAPARDPAPSYGPPPADPPPMTYGPPPPRDPEPPPRTQTRVVFLSPVKEKKKEKFWKKDNRGGNFNAFSVLFDQDTGLSRQSDSIQQPRDNSRGSLRDDYSNRRDDLRDQFWRNRERLFRQQQEAFDLQRLRLEIDLQERQRSEMKKNLFRNLLRDERDTEGGGITSMFYKGVQALGAMALMPITNLIGRKKRDLSSQPMADSIFYSGDVEFENFPLEFKNLQPSQERNVRKSQAIKNGSQTGTKKKYIPKPLTNFKQIKKHKYIIN